MIRQAISCDICGAEMQHANHWFVACENGAELRVTAWNPRGRPRADAKHLCGQTCLHKLMDEFVARTQPARLHPAGGSPAEAQIIAPQMPPKRAAQRTLPARVPVARLAPQPVAAVHLPAAIDEFESSARLIATPAEKEMTGVQGHDFAAELSGISPRNWHAEAWKREREREQRASEHNIRRRSIA